MPPKGSSSHDSHLGYDAAQRSPLLGQAEQVPCGRLHDVDIVWGIYFSHKCLGRKKSQPVNSFISTLCSCFSMEYQWVLASNSPCEIYNPVLPTCGNDKALGVGEISAPLKRCSDEESFQTNSAWRSNELYSGSWRPLQTPVGCAIHSQRWQKPRLT